MDRANETRRADRELLRTRNIGIIAHIDAGKTTVSERILYYTGRIHRMGEVHDGASALDYLEEERERGITITSAATYCEWKGHKIHLIDTPGHIDFTAEVERSLRVLDGAVGVFCAVAGVQPQSETVWRQANRHGVPRLAFVNKIDRQGADFFRCVESMRKRLSARPAPIVHPVGKEKDFRGLIDLVNGQLVTYTDEDMSGKQPLVTPIPAEHEAEYKRGREALIEAIADTSDAIAERYLAGEEVDTPSLKAALRQATIAGQLTPVLCGAALRNKGVQRVLDAVCDYLPSPLDILETRGTHPRTKEPAARPPSPDAPLAALAFKTIADKNGDLTFVRIYSGVLSRGSGVLNPVKDKVERIGRIFRMHAAEREPVEEMRAGDIAAVVGLKHTITGDTLCDPEAPIVLGALTFPEPVISRAVSPKKSDDRDRLADALAKLAKEDPTFKRATDEETGEVIISGMGELHLEVLVNKLRREYRVEVETGAPRVAYRMTLARPVDIEGRHIKQTGGHGQYGVVKVRFEPLAAIDGSVEFEDTIVGGVIPKEYIPSVEKGIRNAAETDRTGFPLVGFKATLWDGSYHEVDSSDLAFQAAGQLSMRMAVEQAGVKLLEPKMRLEVEVPDAYVSGVIADINSRRAEISEIAAGDGDIRYVRGKVPIAEMFGYATTLRSVSQGRGSFSLEPCEYSVVPKAIADKVLEEARKARAR